MKAKNFTIVLMISLSLAFFFMPLGRASQEALAVESRAISLPGEGEEGVLDEFIWEDVSMEEVETILEKALTPKGLPTRNLWAVLVGVEDYPGSSYDLSYCADDANDMRSYLRYGCNVPDANIQFLFNSGGTETNIVNAIATVDMKDSPEDIFVFYFSGHGGYSSGTDEYICPYDSIPSSPSHYINDDELDTYLGWLECGEIYVIIDACFSGGMIPESQQSGRNLMMACRDYEYSWELSSLRNGVFTYYLARAGTYATDSNGDGVKSMEEQFSYAYSNTYSKMLQYSEYQHPTSYDGISGQNVLHPSVGSLSCNMVENILTYDFYLYGHGSVQTVNITASSINGSISINETNKLSKAPTFHGFGRWQGNVMLEEGCNVSGYEVKIEVQGRSLYTHVSAQGDSDGDGLSDVIEIRNGLNVTCNDSDNDGLGDYQEWNGPSDPWNNDTDSDLLSDGDEVNLYSTDPCSNDTDNDDLLDWDEIFIYPTLAYLTDSDSDGLDDYQEIFTYPTDPMDSDSDNDGLSDGLEVDYYGTNPVSFDSDNDGLSDYQELLTYNTNPMLIDTDGDTFSDYDEVVTHGTDPNDKWDFPYIAPTSTSPPITPASTQPINMLFPLLIMVSGMVTVVGGYKIGKNKKEEVRAAIRKAERDEEIRKIPGSRTYVPPSQPALPAPKPYIPPRNQVKPRNPQGEGMDSIKRMFLESKLQELIARFEEKTEFVRWKSMGEKLRALHEYLAQFGIHIC